MTNFEFIDRAKQAVSLHTMYVKGGFGVVLKGYQLERYIKAYSWNTKHEAEIRAAASTQPCFGFDCVGLIKGLLWGFTGDSDCVYGGTIYDGDNDFGTENVPVEKWETDFSHIIPGSVLHTTGHVGIYVGAGLCVEATTANGDNKVRLSCVKNIYKDDTLPSVTWKEWGKLKGIDYDTEKPFFACPHCGGVIYYGKE